ncbi:MAG: VOC family protein [Patescibacteria group bacterium]|nr:VOC family protein [Patescibacteria group bacterium]
MIKYKFFIFSEDPDKLVKFYTDILGFKVIQELKLPRDYGYMVEVEPGYQIWIAKHSEVKGYNKNPLRHILNIYIEDVKGVYERIKVAEGIKIIQEPIGMEEFSPSETARTVCTFLDPEGNCLQLMTPKKS